MEKVIDRLARLVGRISRKAITPFVGRWQEPYLSTFGEQPLKHQPTFIIGAPRVGSTILYQALTNFLDVLYIDNQVCRWHDALFFGFVLSRRRYQDSPHNVFVSERGSTIESGDHAPSECGGFWYRWLERDRHFIDDPEITPRMVRDIRRELAAVMNYFDRPLVIKNLNAGQRLRLLVRCFPDAKFIYVKREAESHIRSLLAVRRAIGVGQGEWWSIKPRNYAALLALPEREMLGKQISSIEEQIEMDSKLFPAGNFMTVQLHEFSPELVRQLGRWMGANLRRNGSIPVFKKDHFSAAKGTPDGMPGQRRVQTP